MHWQRKHNCDAVKLQANLGKKYLLNGELNWITLINFTSFGFNVNLLGWIDQHPGYDTTMKVSIGRYPKEAKKTAQDDDYDHNVVAPNKNDGNQQNQGPDGHVQKNQPEDFQEFARIWREKYNQM